MSPKFQQIPEGCVVPYTGDYRIAIAATGGLVIAAEAWAGLGQFHSMYGKQGWMLLVGSFGSQCSTVGRVRSIPEIAPLVL